MFNVLITINNIYRGGAKQQSIKKLFSGKYLKYLFLLITVVISITFTPLNVNADLNPRIEQLSKGSEITFGGKEWIVYDSGSRALITKYHEGERAFRSPRSSGSGYFNASVGVGEWLNTSFLSILSNTNWILNGTWTAGSTGNESSRTVNCRVALISESEAANNLAVLQKLKSANSISSDEAWTRTEGNSSGSNGRVRVIRFSALPGTTTNYSENRNYVFPTIKLTADLFVKNGNVTNDPGTVVPGKPILTELTETTVKITFDKNGNHSSTKYQIYRDSSKVYEGTSNSYIDTGLSSGTFYTYKIKAISRAGTESGYSPAVSITTIPGPVTELTQITTVKEWGNPNGRIRAVLNWDKPTGATGYLVKIHDGYTWRTFNINNGNTTTWDSSVEKLYPSETILDGYSTGARTIDLFNYSKSGLDLNDDPRNLYRSAQGSSYTNTRYYMFDIQAYGVNGSSLLSGHAYINSTETSALDAEGPTGSIEVISEDGLKKTSSTSVILNVTGSDSKSGLAGVRYSNNATTWSELEPLSSPKEWETSTGAGTKTVYMKLIDNVGNEIVLSDDIYLVDDITGPTVTLGIANGVSFTTSKAVDLVITAFDNFSRMNELQMRFSNDGYLWSAWEPFFDTKTNWDISNAAYGGTSSAGKKSIYVQVLDSAQNTGLARADIGYNAQAPSGSVSLSEGVAGTFNGESVRFVANPNINLSLSFSNVSEMRVSLDGVSYSPWLAYSNILPITLPKGDGLTTVGVQVQNINKVVSSTTKYLLVLDTTAPNVSVKTTNGSTATTTGSVGLTILATDNISTGSFQYQINSGSWIALPSNGQITVSSLTNGLRQIQISVKDQAGNITKQTINIWSL